MKNEPLVSIAIPTYKSAFLGEAIESVLNQTYKNIELHIVNDCSPEDVDSIVQKYKADPRLYYHKNEKNIGSEDPVANWNKCLFYAKGEFFSLLCDDDVYAPSFIEEMINLAYKYPNTNVFRSRVKIVDSNGIMDNMYPSAPEWECYVDYMWAIISGYRLQTISEFMYRTIYIKQSGGYIPLPKAWCSDHASIIKFAKNGGIATCNKLLVNFRMSGLNISSCKSKNVREKIKAQVLYYKLISNFLTEVDVEMRNIIFKTMQDKMRDIMSRNLENARFKDFVFLYLHRNAEYYNISSRSFLKAIYGKLVNFLK